MATVAGWIAPVATMIAAVMTAANLGARVTGWGFAVFVVGSVCWSIVGASTGQTNLLATNAFLTLVNLIGVWRWLGRQRAYEDGGRSATKASQRSAAPTLFTATGIAGLSAEDVQGVALGKAVEALIECGSGRLSYVVVAAGSLGGVDEKLRAIAWQDVRIKGGRLTLAISEAEFLRLPVLEDGAWPSAPPHHECAAA